MDEVEDIYRTSYWMNASCDQMPRATAISVFDWQVNSGKGVTTLQACLGVSVDGIVGHETINELEYWISKPNGEARLLHNYMNYRECCYRQWGHGSQSVFLKGLIDRVESLKKYLKVV
jgi:lysozyme family protein